MKFKSSIARARTMLFVFGALVGVLQFAPSLGAQINFGRILGTVTDQSGGVIVGATVTIIDTQRGPARTLTTDQAGEYNAPNLLPGTYTVRLEANGFQTLNRENVTLEVGKEVRVDLTPTPGATNQSVTVSEALPLVDTTSATLGGVLTNADINDLPLNGRNYQSLMGLRPGVMLQKGGSPWTQSTNNVRPDENSWMIDGMLSINFYDARPVAGGGGYFTDAATILPVDSIQEFNLIENPKADYGGKPGAVVNVGIRSGTNQLHGTAYAFGRDGSWDARNLFNPAPNVILPVRLEQFGGALGGPIKKDKLFFFANYEGQRSLLGSAVSTSTPETASQANTAGFGPAGDTQNSMVDAIRALQNAPTPVPVSPVSLQLLGCPSGPLTTASTCTGGLIPGAQPNTTSNVSTIPLNNNSNNGVAKIDYHINNKNMVNGMFYKSYYVGDGIDRPVINKLWSNTNIEQALQVNGTWIYTATSSLVNEFRAGYIRVGDFIGPDDTNLFANGKDYPLNTGITSTGGFPVVKIGGFISSLGGTGGRPQTQYPNEYLEFQDNVSYLRGKHAFKFGVDVTRVHVDSLNQDTRGEIDFVGSANSNSAFLCPAPNPTGASCSTSLEDFFAGLPSFGSQLIGNADDFVSWHSIGGFVQDDWRITPRIMINLGIRYAYTSPLRDDHNHFGNFDPNLGMVQQGQPSVGSTLWKPDYGNWSPRIGFAWDLTGKGTTVIRGAGGIFYSLFDVASFNGWSPPNSRTSIDSVPTGSCTTAVATIGTPCPQTFGGTLVNGLVQIPGPSLKWNNVVFPSGNLLSCTVAVPCNLGAVDPHLKTPYIASWNFGVQHAFTNNLSLDVSYVGNHGGNLLGIIDINQANLGSVTNQNPNGVRPFSAKFNYLQFINEIVNDARSNYDSVQTTLTQRLSHGLDLTAGYTYGHGLDNGSENRGVPPQNSLNPGAEYSSSDFDVRHRFTLTAGYQIPGKKGFGQLLQGWKLNTILTIQSAQPWTIQDTSDNFSGTNEFTERWDFFGNPSDFKVTASSLPFCSGFGTAAGVTCTSSSGISGIASTYSSSQTASFAQACQAVAPDPTTLDTVGCYVSPNGRSVMVPPVSGTFGTMGRNIFRDTGFKNVDFSVFKNFTFKERYNATFRVEFFNLFNHPDLANPWTFGTGGDPSAHSTFGCACATPDVAAGNAIVGSGSSRDIQLGFKLTF